MSSSFGKNIICTIFGQSHSEAIGVVIDGLPAGEAINLEQAAAFMRRRRAGRNPTDTKRREEDCAKVVSGLHNGFTCGAPLCAVIENNDVRSKDYDQLRQTPRPGHADFSLAMKHNGYQDARGGGHSSGRLTAPLCFAGAVCAQILARRGVFLGAHIIQLGQARANSFDAVKVSAEDLIQAREAEIREAFQVEMREAAEARDSIGGVIECAAIGLPIGLGDPMFDGIENRLSAALFGIPAVRGVSFGAGFGAAAMRGSQNNDDYIFEDRRVRTKTNHHGGVLGGVTTGMPLILCAAIKPTPSIGLPQRSVRMDTRETVPLTIEGRHDACVVPRAVPVVEAVTACVLLDMMKGSDK
ncbi:MAG: chorismate synthase [Oscillospiraceae bacterium]|jgi:chorismate synthase|nr:chorismate synthase [Oscillospiraceae bacterium]